MVLWCKGSTGVFEALRSSSNLGEATIFCAYSSVAERDPSKFDVTSSSLVTRSNLSSMIATLIQLNRIKEDSNSSLNFLCVGNRLLQLKLCDPSGS